jgi:hypothetical protein
MRYISLYLVVLSLLISHPLHSQRIAEPIQGVDSLLAATPGLAYVRFFQQTEAAQPETTAVRDTKSPGKAVLFSAVLPGLGQIYTKSYWKLPIIWGLGGYYIHEWTKYNNRYRDYRDQYKKSLESSSQGDLQIRNLRDFYRSARDSFAWYFGILYLANLVDAYVSASLYEFDVSDDLSVRVGESGRVVTLRWRF